MRKIVAYLNPMAHLGERKYSVLFPLFTMLIMCVLSEVFAYGVAKDPMAVAAYAIFLPVALIIYFSFREGIRGGVVASAITIAYYFYIIYTRHYKGAQLSAGIDTTVILGLLYFSLAGIIGWLKERIDQLIDREADEKRHLRAIIQQLPVGVLITDEKGRLQERNTQLDRILGVKMPIGFRIGKDTLKKTKINGKAIKPRQSPLFQALTSGKPVVGKEFVYEHGNGKKSFLRVSSAPIHNSKKQIIAAASIIIDITHQKELEQQKDDFLSMASHELKTPITSLKMFIELLSKHRNSEKTGYFIERIRDQANRLKELTNDLLDVSRIQTGKLRFNKETFNLSELVKDTIEGLQGTTKKHELLLKNGYKQTVVGDRYRIYQVLVNLISNAIKYSGKGEKIIIQVRKKENTVEVSVKDFGIGIDEEQQAKVFDRLYQVTDPEEKTFPGLGLGLYISKEIIERHKGEMWVESRKGKGSTFFFTLPLVSQKE